MRIDVEGCVLHFAHWEEDAINHGQPNLLGRLVGTPFWCLVVTEVNVVSGQLLFVTLHLPSVGQAMESLGESGTRLIRIKVLGIVIVQREAQRSDPIIRSVEVHVLVNKVLKTDMVWRYDRTPVPPCLLGIHQ